MNNRSELTQLMRFMAAALVLYAHHTYYYFERIDPLFRVSTLGPAGVALFFMISGLVMVVSTRRIPLNGAGAKDFMLRRLIRVVPAYWVATTLKVLIAIVLPQLVLSNGFDFVRVLASYFFVPMFNDAGAVQPILGVGWTLIHEMYFYLVFAAALVLGLRPWVAVSAFIVVVCFTGFGWAPKNASMVVATHPFNLYFVLGMVAGAAVCSKRYPKQLRYAVSASMYALLVLNLFYPDSLAPFIAQPVALLLGGTMLLAYDVRLPAVLRPLVKLGDSSYTLYLFHTFYSTLFLLILHRVLPSLSPWGDIWLSVVIAIPVAHAIYVYFERPLTARLNTAFFPK